MHFGEKPGHLSAIDPVPARDGLSNRSDVNVAQARGPCELVAAFAIARQHALTWPERAMKLGDDLTEPLVLLQ